MQTRQGDRREQMRWDMHWSPEQKVQLQVAGIKKKNQPWNNVANWKKIISRTTTTSWLLK